MQVTTQQQFDDIMNDPLTNISTVIEFPGGTVDWVLDIIKPCTIFGNNTTIDLSSLGHNIAMRIIAQIDISDLTILNSEKTAILIEGVQNSRFEKIRAGHSQYGWILRDSQNNEFDECEAYNNNTGLELIGSSNIIGDIDSYQELGLSGIQGTDNSGLVAGKDYYFKVGSDEYTFTAVAPLKFDNLIHQMNYANRISDNQILKANFLVTLTAGDIRVSSLTSTNVELDRGETGTDLFKYIIGFDTREETIIQCQPDVDFSLQSKYWFFNTFDNEYFIWYNVSNGGVDPSSTGQALEGTSKIGLVVNLNKDDNANIVAEKTENVLATIIDVIEELELERTDDTIIFTEIPGGDSPDSQDVNTGFIFTINDGALDGVFETTFGQILENDRTDRTQNNTFFNSLYHNNSVGIKLINSNNNEFTNCQVYQNTNIGLWQTDVSFGNIFRGEVYENVKYGMRNTDKEHPIDAQSTWWGDQNGPKGGGRGDGDKISNYVIFEPWLQSGTEPELSYPATRQWIWHMLGYPQVAVELTEEQVSECISVSLDKFHYYWQTEPYYVYLDIGQGENEIELPLEIRKENIIEVSYTPQTDIFSQLSGSGESFFLTYYMQRSGGTFLADFYVAMAYKETFERTLGIVPSYEFITHPDKNGVMRDYVRVYPSPSQSAIKVGLKVFRTLSEMETDQQMWIRKYALAWAKEMLGQIRSKFSSIPGPTGEVSLKGDALIAEAQQERERLVQDLIKRSQPLGFTTG